MWVWETWSSFPIRSRTWHHTADTRSVYLPADQWLDYNTKSNLYTGPANITAAAPIQTIPLFVNQGAIIPRGDILQGNNTWTPNWAPYLRIEFFPSENSGSSFPYYTGSSVQTIACTNQNHTLNIQFGNLGYAGNLQVYLESLGSVAGTVVSNGVSLASGTGYTYNPATHLLQVPFNGPTTLVVSNAGSLFSPLEAWRVANFGNPSDPAVSGDGANPSGDGIPNILKYAFGLNPLAVSTNGLPFESTVTNLGTNYLALTFPRATNASGLHVHGAGDDQLGGTIEPVADGVELLRREHQFKHGQHDGGKPGVDEQRGDDHGAGQRADDRRAASFYDRARDDSLTGKLMDDNQNNSNQ